MIMGKSDKCDAGLVKLFNALNAFGPRAGLAKDGQKQGGEDANDGDDQKQFQDCKSPDSATGGSGLHYLLF